MIVALFSLWYNPVPSTYPCSRLCTQLSFCGRRLCRLVVALALHDMMELARTAGQEVTDPDRCQRDHQHRPRWLDIVNEQEVDRIQKVHWNAPSLPGKTNTPVRYMT